MQTTSKLLAAALVALVLALSGCSKEEGGTHHGESAKAASASVAADPMLAPILERWTGDLPEMRERRILRVLVSYSPTRFQIVKGERQGFEAEMMGRFDEVLNQGIPKDQYLEVVYLPVPFHDLIPNLLDGRGDVIAAGMTVTPERSALVDFSEPYRTGVSEVVVARGPVEGLSKVEDLSGRTVHVVRGSSWVESLRALDERLRSEGRDAIEIVEMDPFLEVHDILELVSAGVVEMTVADLHEAELWAEVLPQLAVQTELELAQGRSLAWAVRPDSPELLGALNDFVQKHRKGTLMGNMLFKRYYGNTRRLENPLKAEERARMERLRPLFEEYGEMYDIDWLMLAAQGFQESGLDQGKTSASGAVGVMQIKHTTAAGSEVGIPDIAGERNNIHAGTKYLAYLRDTYFDDPELEPRPRLHFALAGYNAGPSRVKKLREEASRRGLDPNLWFSNVEQVALDKVGREPVRYVANIHKYYVAYRLALEVQDRRKQARSGV